MHLSATTLCGMMGIKKTLIQIILFFYLFFHLTNYVNYTLCNITRPIICLVDFSVRITTAQFPLPAVCAKDQIDDWFDRLAECLHWNVRKPQKVLNSKVSSDSSVINDEHSS